eukprot:SAG31_NODE_5717_length_2365_cov_1.321271_2_plen_530_part_01
MGGAKASAVLGRAELQQLKEWMEATLGKAFGNRKKVEKNQYRAFQRMLYGAPTPLDRKLLGACQFGKTWSWCMSVRDDVLKLLQKLQDSRGFQHFKVKPHTGSPLRFVDEWTVDDVQTAAKPKAEKVQTAAKPDSRQTGQPRKITVSQKDDKKEYQRQYRFFQKKPNATICPPTDSAEWRAFLGEQTASKGGNQYRSGAEAAKVKYMSPAEAAEAMASAMEINAEFDSDDLKAMFGVGGINNRGRSIHLARIQEWWIANQQYHKTERAKRNLRARNRAGSKTTIKMDGEVKTREQVAEAIAPLQQYALPQQSVRLEYSWNDTHFFVTAFGREAASTAQDYTTIAYEAERGQGYRSMMVGHAGLGSDLTTHRYSIGSAADKGKGMSRLHQFNRPMAHLATNPVLEVALGIAALLGIVPEVHIRTMKCHGNAGSSNDTGRIEQELTELHVPILQEILDQLDQEEDQDHQEEDQDHQEEDQDQDIKIKRKTKRAKRAKTAREGSSCGWIYEIFINEEFAGIVIKVRNAYVKLK